MMNTAPPSTSSRPKERNFFPTGFLGAPASLCGIIILLVSTSCPKIVSGARSNHNVLSGARLNTFDGFRLKRKVSSPWSSSLDLLKISGGSTSSVGAQNSAHGIAETDNIATTAAKTIDSALQGGNEGEVSIDKIAENKEDGTETVTVDADIDNNANANVTPQIASEHGGDDNDDDGISSSNFTPPLRISTSQDGDNVVTTDASAAAAKKALTKQEKRRQRRDLKLARKEERSHKKYAKKLKNRNNLNIRRKVLHAVSGLTFAILNQVLPKGVFVAGSATVTTITLAMELLRYRKDFAWINDVLHTVLGGSLRKHEMEGKFTGSFYYFLGVTLTSALFPTSCASLGICQLALADPSASYFGRQTRHVYWSRIENGLFGFGRNKGVLGFLGGALFCFPFNYYVLSIAKYGGAVGVIGTTVETIAEVLADGEDGPSGSVPIAAKIASTVLPGGRKSIAIASIALGFAGAFADLCVPTPALTMPKKIWGIPMPPFHVDDNVVVPIVSGYACTKIFDYLGWTAGLELANFILF